MSEIPTDDWTWINAAADRFERAWKDGQRPRIEDDLAEVEESRRPRLLEELLRVERELRRRAGEEPTAEEYRGRFPDYAAMVDAVFAPEPGQSARTDPTSTAVFTPGQVTEDADLAPGTHVRYFGDYELLLELGRGSMGVVYKARQISLNRLVALKMIRSAALASGDDLRRFHNEAEAIATLDHPHIVPILEVGSHEGQSYFSMKLIDGPSLERKLTDYASDPKAAARLMTQAAQAVHHAHQRGILHRDLKPANILLDAEGQPYVSDFGLAKRVEEDIEMTASGAILGTPAYMAPEQASARRGAVTTASDVYGLGAVLYALLTGRAPFRSDSVAETLEQVRQLPPVSPSRLNALTPRDLEIICLKCLEKDPRRRYASAEALAEDLWRWYRGEPIAARPVRAWERTVMWARRKPTIATLLGLLALVTSLGLGGVLWEWRAAVLARNNAQAREQDALDAQAKERKQTELAERAGYESRTKALDAMQSLGLAYYNQAQVLQHSAGADRQNRALKLLQQVGELRQETENIARQLGDDPDGRRLALQRFWNAHLTDLRTEAIRWLSRSSLEPLTSARFPVASQGPGPGGFVPNRGFKTTDLALSPDGATLVFLHTPTRENPPGLRDRVEIIDANSGKVVGGFDLGPASGPPSVALPTALAFDAGAQHLLVARSVTEKYKRTHIIEQRSLRSGTVAKTVPLVGRDEPPPAQPALPARWVFSPDRRYLLMIPRSDLGSVHGPVVWSSQDGKPACVFEPDFSAQGFAASGSQVVGLTGSQIEFREVATGKAVRRFPFPEPAGALGRNPGPAVGRARGDTRSPYINMQMAPRLVVSPDDQWLAVIEDYKFVLQSAPPQFPIGVMILDATSGQVRARHPMPTMDNTYQSQCVMPLLAFGAEGRLLAVVTARQVTIFTVPEGKLVLAENLPVSRVTLPTNPQEAPRHQEPQLPIGLQFDREGARIVTATDPTLDDPEAFNRFQGRQSPPVAKQRIVQIWDVSQARLRPELQFFEGAIQSVRFGPRDRLIAVGGDDRQIHVRDQAGHRWTVGYAGQGGLFQSDGQEGNGVTRQYGRFDPSGRVFTTRLADRVDLWDTKTGRLRRSFSPGPDLKTWDPTTGQFQRSVARNRVLTTSPDERAMVILDYVDPGKQAIRVLGIAEDEWILTIPEAASPVEFSPDSRYLVAQVRTRGGGESSLIVGDLAERRIVHRLQFGEPAYDGLNGRRWWFGPDGKIIAVYGKAAGVPTLRVYELATGQQIGELKSPVPRLDVGDRSLNVWFSPDARQIALLVEPGPRGAIPQASCYIWRVDKTEATRIGDSWIDSSRSSAAFTRDGSRLVLAGIKPLDEGSPIYGKQVPTIQIWDVTDGHEPRLLMSEKEIQPIDDKPFLFDVERGRMAAGIYASPKGARSCVIWDVATGHALERYAGDVRARTGGGQFLLQPVDRQREGQSYTLIPWATGGPKITVRSTVVPVVSPDRRTAVTDFVHGTAPVGLWDLSNGRLRSELKGQITMAAPRSNGEIDAVFSPDGMLVATQSVRGQPTLNLWDAATGRLVRSLSTARPAGTADRPILDGSFSGDGKRFAFNLNDRYRILDVETGQVQALDRAGHRAAIRTVDISPDGVVVASAGDDAAICFWEAATGRFVTMLEQVSEPIREIAFSPADGHFAARDAAGQVRVWKLDRSSEGGRLAVTASLLWTGADAATALVFSRDGAVLVTGDPNGTIQVRRANDGGLVTALQDGTNAGTGTGAVLALAMSSDGGILASAAEDGIVRLWDWTGKTLRARLAAHQMPIRAVALGGGDLLAVAAGGVEIWDIKSGESLMNLEGHSRAVTALSFSPDGRMLATGSEDQSVALWDLEEFRRQLLTLHLYWCLVSRKNDELLLQATYHDSDVHDGCQKSYDKLGWCGFALASRYSNTG